MLFFKLSFILALISLVDGSCAPGDRLVGDLCYVIMNIQLSYPDSRDFCHSSSMNLAVIHTQNQASFIANYVRLQTSSSMFWIGLSRQNNAKFQWDDGSALIWSNFDGNFPQNDIFVAESTTNTRWQTLNGEEKLFFVCSYDPNDTLTTTTTPVPTTTPQATTTTTVTTTTAPKPEVSCLFMFDSQTSGIDAAAVATYKTYFDFAMTIGNKLAEFTKFTGTIDNFGYSPLEDHENYIPNSLDAFNSLPFIVDTTDTFIDLDLKDVDFSLANAVWVPAVRSKTCLIFISAAAEADFGGTTIKTSYDSFGTVVGALVGGATMIPGLTNVVAASTLSDADADAIVIMILENLPGN